MDLVRFIATAFSRSGRRKLNLTLVDGEGDPRHQLGRRGEEAAARFLRRSGCKVLYRNFRAPHGGEVDIVCRDGNTLVFVEVKTRHEGAFGAPAEAVTSDKECLIARGALHWLMLLGHPDILFRFDIAEVRAAAGELEVSLIKNAFALPAPYRYSPQAEDGLTSRRF